MRTVRIQLLKNSAILAEKCLVAESFRDRLVGLMGRRALAEGEGMLFPECTSIHMWGMRFAIDVVFVREGRVTSVHPRVRAWKWLPLLDWKAREAIELPVGTIERCKVQPGDEIGRV